MCSGTCTAPRSGTLGAALPPAPMCAASAALYHPMMLPHATDLVYAAWRLSCGLK